MKRFLKDISISILGCSLAAFGTACFLLPNQLSSGGFSGIATILYYFFNFKMGTTIIILNIPVFIIAYIKMGKNFVSKTIISTIAFSKLIDVFTILDFHVEDKFLASIYGGILIGIGLALIFKVGSSTGGSDLIATITQAYNPYIKTGQVLVIIDFVIVLLNLIVFKNVDIGLYSFIAIYLISKMVDLVFEGINFSKMIYIISDNYEQISKAINKELKKGATEFYGRGSYKGNDKRIVMCVTKRNNIVRIKELANSIDSNAFIIISDVREVYGLGFKNS